MATATACVQHELKHPNTTLARAIAEVIATEANAIGVATAVFSVVDMMTPRRAPGSGTPVIITSSEMGRLPTDFQITDLVVGTARRTLHRQRRAFMQIALTVVRLKPCERDMREQEGGQGFGR